MNTFTDRPACVKGTQNWGNASTMRMAGTQQLFAGAMTLVA